MSSIEFSAPFIASVPTATSAVGASMSHRVFGGLNSTTTMAYVAGPGTVANARPLFDTPSTNRAVTQLILMGGAVPTDFSTLTSYSSRSADALISFSTSNSGMNDFIVSPTAWSDDFNAVGQTTITTQYKAVTAAGKATWAWLVCRQATTSTVFTDVLYHQMIGTVGIVGSGADIELPDVNLVVGKMIRVANMKLSLQSLFTY